QRRRLLLGRSALVGIAKKRMKRIAKLEKKGKISAGEAELARRRAIKATNLADIRDMYQQRGKRSACGNSSPLTCTWVMPRWLAFVASMTGFTMTPPSPTTGARWWGNVTRSGFWVTSPAVGRRTHCECCATCQGGSV